MPLSRRRLLAGGAVLAGAAGVGGAASLVGGQRLDRALGRCGPEGRPSPPSAWTVHRDRLTSRAVDHEVPFVVALPADLPADGPEQPEPPVCLCLHGGNGSAAWVVDTLRFQDHVAAGTAGAGLPPFALVAAGAGPTGWRRGPAGDPHTMLLDELLPLTLERYGVGRGPLAVAGWSMGGFGALHLAQRRPERFAAVAVVSPAISRSSTASSGTPPSGRPRSGIPSAGTPSAGTPLAGTPSADTSSGTPEVDVVAHADRLRGLAVRVDCGQADSFAAASRQLVGALGGSAEGHFPEGCHDLSFRHRVAPEQASWLARALQAAR